MELSNSDPTQCGLGVERYCDAESTGWSCWSPSVLMQRVMWFLGGLLPLPHVQFRKTENSWRLDRSHRGGHRCDIPCLVVVADVRTVIA